MAFPMKNCPTCGELYQAFIKTACPSCHLANQLYRKHGTGQVEAIQAVNREVKQGRIQPPTAFACVDCGKPAAIYEHRDYNKPLDVEPVCHSCNHKRGYAIPKKMTFDEFVSEVRKKTRYKHATAAHFEYIRRRHFTNDNENQK